MGIDPSSYSLLVNKWPQRNRVKRVVNREAFRVMTALINGLVGAASGSNVTATHKRIAAVVGASGGTPGPIGGGQRTIETITDINRNTTAADITAIKEMLYNVKARPSTYPKDLSGNGGPSY